jgi:DNA-binding CsgD family transcriptional regulator
MTLISFVVCLAMAAAAILIAHQFTTTYSRSFHRHYFYYLVAFYVFAIYGLWGRILGRALLETLGADFGLAQIMASFVSVLGVPILFVSWLMLTNMAYALTDKAVGQGWIALHAVVFVLLLLGGWITFAAIAGQADVPNARLGRLVVLAIVGLELLYFAAFLLIALRSTRKQHEARRRPLRLFALLLAGAFLLRSASLPLAFTYPWMVVTVLVYFGSNLVPLLYLRARADRLFEPVKAETASAETMERLFDEYGVTKRERQIVREICSGKTNQQIADTLFISLQTVKDHTHRIYSKIGVKSRVQLVQKMGG